MIMRNRTLSKSSKSIEGVIIAFSGSAGREAAIVGRAILSRSGLAKPSHNRLAGRNLAVERNEAHGRIVDNGSAHRQNVDR